MVKMKFDVHNGCQINSLGDRSHPPKTATASSPATFDRARVSRASRGALTSRYSDVAVVVVRQYCL